MESNKEDMKLPDGWVVCNSKSIPGKKYFFNKKTGKSSWTKPEDIEKPCNMRKKSKKGRAKCQDSKKEEVLCKKAVKRKNDSYADGSSEQKCSKETIVPRLIAVAKRKGPPKDDVPKCNTADLSKTELPKNVDNTNSSKTKLSKREDSNCNITNLSNNKLPKKCNTTKNSANAKLAKFREQLNSEAKQEDKLNIVSPSKKKTTSKKCNSQETQTRNKSPNLNDSKFSSTSQSPSNDNGQVTLHSQFLTANKILSSMKAQLPEKYDQKEKHKDTFYSDIVEGISNKMPEYSAIKHPATPLQFSIADKLLSAMKSKLTHKTTVPDESNIKKFKSAKDRMEALKRSFTIENEEITSSQNSSLYDSTKDSSIGIDSGSESMEVEDIKEMNIVVPENTVKYSVTHIPENFVLVVDTNIFIHELNFIKTVLNSHIKGYAEQPALLIPWRVINELDKLKDNNNGNGALCKRARVAMDYLYKSLPENSRLRGQSLRESNSHIFPCEIPDDEILNCCLQQVERGKNVLLLSNDKNLCNKAVINGVKHISLSKLQQLLENKPQSVVDPGLYASVKHYENTIYQLLANILENEMRAKYNSLWQRVIFKAPPWTLADVLQCLLKHWFAVFAEVFPRIEHLLRDLKNALASIAKKDPKSLCESEVANFKELCLDLAKKCQIIPEYMSLAKTTVGRFECARADGAEPPRESETVVNAFENVWTVFSSYCAKLATALGISHTLEDKLPGEEPVHVLTNKWEFFRTRLDFLTRAVEGALSVENTSELIMEDQIGRLESALKDCLTLISLDSSISRDELRIFCITNRNMLQEGFAKLCGLTNLMDICKNCFNTCV